MGTASIYESNKTKSNESSIKLHETFNYFLPLIQTDKRDRRNQSVDPSKKRLSHKESPVELLGSTTKILYVFVTHALGRASLPDNKKNLKLL